MFKTARELAYLGVMTALLIAALICTLAVVPGKKPDVVRADGCLSERPGAVMLFDGADLTARIL